MSNIPIRDLTQTGTPSGSSYLVFDDGVMRKGTFASAADAIRPVASQAEAEAGAENTKTMTPLRVEQAIVNNLASSPNIVTPTGITKSDVGLGNVDNTSDATKNAAAATLTNKTLTSPAINAPSINGGTLAGLSSLGVRDTSAAFDVTLLAASSPVLTAARTITFNVKDFSPTFSMNGSLTLGSNFTTAGNFGLTMTQTGITNVTLPTTGTLATLAGAETLSNKTLVAPALGTPSSVILTNATGLPLSTGVTGTLQAAQFPALTGDVTSVAGALASTIANNAVSNAKMATAGAATIKGNPTGSTANVQDFTIQGLTARGAPDATNDKIPLFDNAAGTIKYVTPQQIASAGVAGVSSLNGQTGALKSFYSPQGRLTLVTGVASMTTSQASKSTLYYTPYCGNIVPLYDLTNMVPTTFTELSIATTDTTKNPAAIGASKVNDWFVWNDSGTLRLTHGPDWTNDTARSAGTALVMVNGILLNNAAITNGPGASRGTYVGTTRSDASSQLNWVLPSTATNGVAGLFNVWNAFNRVDISGFSGMTAVSWNYGTAATWRQQNAQTSNNISFVRGLDEDGISAVLSAQIAAASGVNAAVAIGLDSTTAPVGRPMYSQNNAFATPVYAFYDGLPGLGYHVVNPLEYNLTTTASTWYGTGGTTYLQTGLSVRMRA